MKVDTYLLDTQVSLFIMEYYLIMTAVEDCFEGKLGCCMESSSHVGIGLSL
jgi:hypothetical protein